LTPEITVNFQDQAQPLLYDLDQGSNAFLLRGVVPYKLGGVHQLLRYTLPVVSAPNGNGGTTTGLGDLNLFDVFLFSGSRKRWNSVSDRSSHSQPQQRLRPAQVNGQSSVR
jgi:hypothetical protein